MKCTKVVKLDGKNIDLNFQGIDSDTKTSVNLMQGYINLMDKTDCVKQINAGYKRNGLSEMSHDVSDQQLCAMTMSSSGKPVDTCNGDSGGPLTYGINSMERKRKIARALGDL